MGRTGQLCLRGIERYRTSELARRSRGCCRFTPSCSHYAEQALRERQLLMALLLIARRVVRCRASVPVGTVDRVGARVSMTKVRAVLLLSAMVTLGTAALAQAVQPTLVTDRVTRTQGGCTMAINGRDIGGLNRNHPLVVHKGGRFHVEGLAPVEIRNAPEPPGGRTTMFFSITVVNPFSQSTEFEPTNGIRTFSTNRSVDRYLKYGAGLYKVDGSAEGTDQTGKRFTCSATFFIRLDGNTAAGFVSGLVAAAGLAGAATSGGKPNWEAGDTPPENEGEASGDVIGGAWNDANEQMDPDTRTNRTDNIASYGCFMVLVGFLAASHGGTPDFAAIAPMPADPNSGRVRRRGHPVRGFISGLFLALGITLCVQQRGYWILTWQNTIAFPLATAVLFAVKGWRGKAFIPRASGR